MFRFHAIVLRNFVFTPPNWKRNMFRSHPPQPQVKTKHIFRFQPPPPSENQICFVFIPTKWKRKSSPKRLHGLRPIYWRDWPYTTFWSIAMNPWPNPTAFRTTEQRYTGSKIFILVPVPDPSPERKYWYVTESKIKKIPVPDPKRIVDLPPDRFQQNKNSRFQTKIVAFFRNLPFLTFRTQIVDLLVRSLQKLDA